MSLLSPYFPALFAGLLFPACLVVQRMAQDQRHLAEGEQKRDRHDAPDLEGNPGVGGKIAPHHFVDDGQENKEQAPAEGEFSPAFGIELEGRIEDIAEQRPAEVEAAEQHAAEQRVDDGWLHLDEDVVLQV